jgi:hypothetical protein
MGLWWAFVQLLISFYGERTMNDSTEVRLENLERELAETKAKLCRVGHRNLWLLRGGILMAGLLALAWMSMNLGCSAPSQKDAVVHKEIRARSFVVVDEQGRERAELSIGSNIEGPALVLRDEQGAVRALLDVNKDGHAFLVIGSENKARAMITVSGAGPMLTLSNEKISPGVLLILGKDGPKVDLSDEKGNDAILSVNDSQPGLILRDEKLNGAILSVKADIPGLVLSEKNGCSANLTVGKNHSSLDLIDEEANTRSYLSVTKDKQMLKLMDKKGKAIKTF